MTFYKFIKNTKYLQPFPVALKFELRRILFPLQILHPDWSPHVVNPAD